MFANVLDALKNLLKKLVFRIVAGVIAGILLGILIVFLWNKLGARYAFLCFGGLIFIVLLVLFIVLLFPLA